MDVSKNRGGPPKSSILIGFFIINHPFWGTPIFGNTNMDFPLPFHIEYHRETSSLVPISFTRMAIGVAGHRQPNGMEIGRGRVAVVGVEGNPKKFSRRLLSSSSHKTLVYVNHGPPKPTCFFRFLWFISLVLVRWPKPLCFHGLLGGPHGMYCHFPTKKNCSFFSMEILGGAPPKLNGICQNCCTKYVPSSNHTRPSEIYT